MGEKTEKASPKKLRDARKKGQVAKSQDLPSAFTFIASLWITVGMMGFMYTKISAFLTGTFDLVTRQNLEIYIPTLYYEAFVLIFLCSIPVMMLVSLVGMAITFLSVGPVFAPEAFKFDIKKFDPIQNLKAKFKVKTLFELVKSIFKITIATVLIYGTMYNSLPVLIHTVNQDVEVALWVFYYFLMEVVFKVGLFFIVVAVIDFVFQKRNFANEMKMEKFEVKQEYKNTEGDPHIKGKRKQIAQEIAYQEGPSGGVKGAQAVVTNPTHLAIAIGYEREMDPAPYILGMGEGILAQRMIDLAKKNDVPIVRNIGLAHKLWEEGELYEFVPEETYEAVAEIIRWVQQLQADPQTAGQYFGDFSET
jgi:type III secretion YscU/HrpY family protein